MLNTSNESGNCYPLRILREDMKKEAMVDMGIGSEKNE